MCFFRSLLLASRESSDNFLRLCPLWARRPPGGVGSSTRRGGGRKVRALSRKFVFPGLGVPDVSRERMCLQTSPEQLKATKDKKETKKIGISVPGRLGSFSVGGTKNFKHCNIKTEKFHTSGVCLREDQKSRTKSWTINFRNLRP